jgi:hypothetical protein
MNDVFEMKQSQLISDKKWLQKQLKNFNESLLKEDFGAMLEYKRLNKEIENMGLNAARDFYIEAAKNILEGRGALE